MRATQGSRAVSDAPPRQPTSQADANSRRAAATLALTLPSDTVLYLLLPMYAPSFGVSLAEAGVLLAANRLVRILGYGWVARFYARNGDRPACMLAAAATVICAIGYATLSGFWALLPMRLLWGLSFAALNLSTQTMSTSDPNGAARRNGRTVDMSDFEKAKDKIIMGAERRSIVMPEEERRNTAYHESGHAIVAKMLPKTDPVHKVTIIPRGRALGVTMQLPESDRYSMDKERLLNTIAVLFGGRVAEELFMNQMTTGASNDFERATAIARDIVTRYGMTEELGPMVYAENEGEVFLGRSVTKTTHVSEATMQKVDAEIRRIIDEQYQVARKILEANRDKVEAMAAALLEWETIDADQIDDIINGRPPRPPKTPEGPSDASDTPAAPGVAGNGAAAPV